MEISEPVVVAKLPRLQVESGRNLFSTVYSLKNGVKRKRQEICAAVDGDSINIYEVSGLSTTVFLRCVLTCKIRNGRALSSHPVPPDATFSCAPYAVQVQDPRQNVSRNIYYAGKRRNELLLSVSREDLGGLGQAFSNKSVTLADTSSVIQLDALSEVDHFRLIVAREHGSFEFYNGNDLSRLKSGILGGTDEDDRLVSVRWLSSSQALRSVLKARPDLLTGAERETSFIFGVFCNSASDKPETPKVKVGVWEVPNSLWQNPDRVSLVPLYYHKLSISAPLVHQEQMPITMVHKDTRMVIKTQSMIYTYDLTSTLPRKLCEASSPLVEQLSSIPMSESLLLSSTPNSLQVHNTTFRTLQSKLDLNTNSLKRKRPSSLGGHVIFVAFFPKLSRAIAIRRSYLVAIDVRDTTGKPVAAATKQTSLLVNNLGRGILGQEKPKSSIQVGEVSIGKLSTNNDQKGKWQKVARQFEEFRQTNDVAGFTKLFVEHVASTEIKTSRQTKTIPDWKANYIISKMFEISEATQAGSDDATQRLRLILPAHDVLVYLAEHGLLTADKVFRALGFEFEPGSARHEYREFMNALIESNSTLDLVREHLTKAVLVNRWEICSSIQLLLQRALARTRIVSSSDNDSHPKTIVDVSTNQSLDQQVSNAQEEADVRSCLCIAIERLCGFAPTLLSTYIRAHFQQTEIVALIQFLRQQLFRSGYTTSLQARPYPSPPTSEPGAEVQDVVLGEVHEEITLGAIASTLSDCIDAIGPTGMLSFGDEGEFVQSLIPELSSEVSRAVEALQDITSLRGFLRETLRFVESADNGRHQAITTVTDGDVSRSKKFGSILTLYTEPVFGGSAMNNAALLPLGLRTEGMIDKHKVRKGNGSVLKRSEREMGMLQERLRGPYALERLVV